MTCIFAYSLLDPCFKVDSEIAACPTQLEKGKEPTYYYIKYTQREFYFDSNLTKYNESPNMAAAQYTPFAVEFKDHGASVLCWQVFAYVTPSQQEGDPNPYLCSAVHGATMIADPEAFINGTSKNAWAFDPDAETKGSFGVVENIDRSDSVWHAMYRAPGGGTWKRIALREVWW